MGRDGYSRLILFESYSIGQLDALPVGEECFQDDTMRRLSLVPVLEDYAAHERALFRTWHRRVLSLMRADGKTPPDLNDAEWHDLYASSAKQAGVAL